MRDTGLTAGGASLLTMAPVLCLGLFGALAPVLARRLGTEQAVLALLLVLAGGTVPLAEAMKGSWAWALAFWALPALLAAAVWLPLLPLRRATGSQATGHISSLLRDPLAWQVTLFMGLQSSLAYSTFGWLAPILRDRGESAVNAGLIVSVSTLVQMVAALAAPVLASRCRDQRLASAITMALSLAGLLGCLFAPLSTVWVWAVRLGLGLGSAFALALILIVMRSRNSHVAAHMSSMAQSIGYTIAAGGPLLVGLLHDGTGGWVAVGILFTVISAGALLAGRAK